MRAYEGLKPYYGDLHNHCGISYGHGPIEDALAKAHSPDELAQRIANARRGIFDDADDVADAVGAGKGGKSSKNGDKGS